MAVLAALVVAACGSASPTPSDAVGSSSPSIVALSPASSASPSNIAPDASSPAAVSPAPAASPASPAASPAVAHDPTLLSILPASIDGASPIDDPQSLAEAVTNPDFGANVESAAFAVVVDGNDLASGVLAQLRPGVYSEAFFRDWRDTYNQGACAQAGGVVGNAEAELGGRTVHVTSCAGGLLVYHTYLPDRGVVVSMFSLGERRFGEQLMRGLRP